MAQHKYIPWDSVELEDLNPLLKRQFVVGENVMVARVLLKKGAWFGHHSRLRARIADPNRLVWLHNRAEEYRRGQ